MRHILSFLLVTCVAAATEPVKTKDGKALPFSPGERLEYKLVWNKIPVGEMNVQVLPVRDYNGRKVRHFVMTARTNHFADKIYKVRTIISSFVQPDLTRTLRYHTNKREGSSRKVQEMTFDWNRKRVHYLKNGNEDLGWTNVTADAVDPLSLFFVLRTCDLSSKEIKMWVCDGKSSLESKATIVRQERVEVCGRKYSTVLIEPNVEGLRGAFKKSKGAKLQVWVTNDADRLPVKFSSKVVVGKFQAVLVKHVRGQK